MFIRPCIPFSGLVDLLCSSYLLLEVFLSPCLKPSWTGARKVGSWEYLVFVLSWVQVPRLFLSSFFVAGGLIIMGLITEK